jgi:hypothetical protein
VFQIVFPTSTILLDFYSISIFFPRWKLILEYFNLETLPSGAHLLACFSHHARAQAPGFLLQLERMPSAARLKPPPLPPYPIWSEATVALISSSLRRSLPSPEPGPPLKQAIRMALPPLPSSSNRLIVLVLGQAPIGRLTATRTEHVAPDLLSSPDRLTVRITEWSPPMPPTDELLLHRRRPRHPECATPPSPSKPPRCSSERAAVPPPCLRVRVQCRPLSPVTPAPRCPPQRRTLEPLPRPSGSLPSPSCHHLAQKGVHRRHRVCPAGAPAPLPSLPLPRARCSRQCLNHELHQSRPPKAQCYAPKVISLVSVHFRSFGLWHVGSHSPFRC